MRGTSLTVREGSVLNGQLGTLAVELVPRNR